MGEKVMLLLLVVMICGSCCTAGEVHRVGGAAGWTTAILTDNPTFYKSWAASRTFHVGDTILFEYNKEFHDVVRVTHKNFNACNFTAPYKKWATGNDTFTIKRAGHYYFSSGVPGHCSAGQKVDIRVVGNDSSESGPSPSPSPRWRPSAGPVEPPSDPWLGMSPAHPPKKSASSLDSRLNVWFYCVMAFTIAIILF